MPAPVSARIRWISRGSLIFSRKTAGIFATLIWRDDPGDIAGAGLGIGGNAQRRDEFDAVGGGEIAEGVMGRDHLAARRRDLRHRLPGPRGRARRALPDSRPHWRETPRHRPDRRRPARRGYWRHRSSHWRPTARHADRRAGCPDFSGAMPSVAVTIVGLAAGGLHQPRQPAFQPEAVDDDELGVGDLLRIGRRRRIDMRVAIGADQRRDLDAVAADVLDEIAEDREARDDLEPIFARAPAQAVAREHQTEQPE